MIGILLTIILFMSFLLFHTRKVEVPEDCDTSAITKPFYKCGIWMTAKLVSNERIKKAILQKNSEKFYLLKPGKDIAQENYLHLVSKVSNCLLFLTIGCAVVLLISLNTENKSLLVNGNMLKRNEFPKGDYMVELDVTIDGETFDGEKINVPARLYSKKEIEEMLPEFRSLLERAVLGKNTSPNEITEDLSPVDGIEGYPFIVEWSFDRELVKNDGTLRENIPDNGVLMTAGAEISYGGYKELYEFPLMLYPHKMTHREILHAKLLEALTGADDESSQAGEFVLPDETDGYEIRWTERKKDNTLLFFLLVIAASIVIFFASDKSLDNKVKERDEQLMEDYPEIVSKLSLYVGAGMAVRMAWKKITDEYLSRKESIGITRFAYEEMLIASYEMQSGTGELAAYRNFSKRCRVQKYVKLVSLLEQNIKLGAKGFTESLRAESRDALEDKKSGARKKGEEAGTKLLLPMILMLMIVMVVIIVPAFMTM